MAEYNPSKIIKDGNTYNFRDNTKIPLAGSNAISGSLIPSTDGTVNLGGPNYQWNNAYIKSLTINGVACGDILTHNASEFVDVTSAQTIGGAKTFSDGDKTFNASAPLRIQGCHKGNEFSNNARTVLELRSNRDTEDKSCIYITKFRQNRAQGSMGSNDNVILTMDVLENGIRTNDILKFTAQNWINDVPTEVYLEPATKVSNIQSFLGSSIRPWRDTATNTINGINPGALSLPNISSTGANAWIAIDTTDWVASLATSAAQKYMPPADGWLNVRVDNAVALGLALTDGGNYMHQMVRSGTPSGLALLLPVFKNKEVAILVSGNENFAYNRVTFYYCQGNV